MELTAVARSGNVLAGYGVPVVGSRVTRGAEAAVLAAGALGFPVAMKVADPELRHRIDLGAVRLDLAGAAAVRAAYEELTRLSRSGAWAGERDGQPPPGPVEVIVQPMVPPGVSLVVEAV